MLCRKIEQEGGMCTDSVGVMLFGVEGSLIEKVTSE